MSALPRSNRTGAGTAILVLVAALAGADAQAFEWAGGKGGSYQLPAGDVHEGDLYAAGLSIDIAGTQHGDIVGWAQTVHISGEVVGDVIVGGQSITIQGNVRDTVRVFGNSLVVHGTIEGDLLVFSGTVTVNRGARVTGDLISFTQILTVEGDVDGDLRGTGQNVNIYGNVGGEIKSTVGELRLRGAVGGDVRVTCDTLRVEPGSTIGGDLVYKSRQRLEGLEELGVVAGKIEYEEPSEDEESEKDSGGISLAWLLWQLFLLASSLLLGWVLIGFFRPQALAVSDAIDREWASSLGVGFVLGIPLPVAALIACILVITIPLAAITLLLWAVAWYVAKLPVALWLGRRLLRLVGMADPSPYLALPIGLVILTAIFQIPYLGFLTYFATVFLGLGAMLLGLRALGAFRGGGTIETGGTTAEAAVTV